MLLDKISGGNNIFGTDLEETKGKTIGEFSNEEWDKVFNKEIRKLTTEAIVGDRGKIPYSILADKDGIIEYKGVVFVGDEDSNSLCLGDMSNPNEVLNIQLSKGGYLKVNVNSFEDLEKAITMFSPEDRNRIMRAIAQYNRLKQIQQQIEDETSGLEVLKKNDDVADYA